MFNRRDRPVIIYFVLSIVITLNIYYLYSLGFYAVHTAWSARQLMGIASIDKPNLSVNSA